MPGSRRRKRILIVGDRRKGRVAALARALEPELNKKSRVIGIDLDGNINLQKTRADLILVLGGDGSILHTAHRVADNTVPLMGVNLGNLGFLATISADETPERIAKIVAGGWSIEERSQLSVEIERAATGKILQIGHALNDVVVDRGLRSRLLTLSLRIDGRPAFESRGDGIVIATPTGSTAYSLAAGGPILHPELNVVLITPICPHSLTNRPVVVPGKSVVEMEVIDSDGEARFTLDGRTPPRSGLRTGDRIRVRLADVKIRLAMLGDDGFYTRLRNKIHFARPASG
ncbi:MAG: NAD(+)/NADH kinase [Planctomycetes bacterium]|nr:NAD(+)/NADH kinase [Planctomycetota bacterium]